MKKILITGGHLMPAVALIDFLKEKDQKKIEFVFVGRKYNLDNDQNDSLEFQEIKKRGIRFIDFRTGRLKREITLAAFVNLINILKGIVKAYFLIKKEKPDIIFSFGGFIGFPFCFSGWLNKIPVFIHEQTVSPGLANQISGWLAKKVFVSFPQAVNFFDKKKVIVSGNPIRKEIFQVIDKPLIIQKDRPVIYVTGGSLGSHSLNQHLLTILPLILKKAIVIHQTGNVEEYNDHQRLVNFKKRLPPKLAKNYHLRSHFLTTEIGYIYQLADMVISRAGANTFFELLALKKPAILIPLPWSAGKEQEKQARIFVQLGLGEIFNQFEKSIKLLKLVEKMIRELDRYQKNFEKKSLLINKKNPCEVIEKEVFSI